jgi:hypothetical protein
MLHRVLRDLEVDRADATAASAGQPLHHRSLNPIAAQDRSCGAQLPSK